MADLVAAATLKSFVQDIRYDFNNSMYGQDLVLKAKLENLLLLWSNYGPLLTGIWFCELVGAIFDRAVMDEHWIVAGAALCAYLSENADKHIQLEAQDLLGCAQYPSVVLLGRLQRKFQMSTSKSRTIKFCAKLVNVLQPGDGKGAMCKQFLDIALPLAAPYHLVFDNTFSSLIAALLDVGESMDKWDSGHHDYMGRILDKLVDSAAGYPHRILPVLGLKYVRERNWQMPNIE